ncbi:helix-turn-helix domain-containing protein [Bacillus cereus]|uniref:helix-turn-helix domain-containing protein n=1 Tax=Bacillus cereus TaxID=1396 RepID=UPI0019D65C48|nr:hypothetical protein [Bacillus cereus]
MKEKEILEKFSIGSQIKSLRKERKWTQQQLAEEFNVDTNMILTGHSTEELTNYVTGTMAVSTWVQSFADTYGYELVAQF